MLTDVQILYSLDTFEVLMSGWNTRQGCAQLERENHHLILVDGVGHVRRNASFSHQLRL
jgi:hypothetical protein